MTDTVLLVSTQITTHCAHVPYFVASSEKDTLAPESLGTNKPWELRMPGEGDSRRQFISANPNVVPAIEVGHFEEVVTTPSCERNVLTCLLTDRCLKNCATNSADDSCRISDVRFNGFRQ